MREFSRRFALATAFAATTAVFTGVLVLSESADAQSAVTTPSGLKYIDVKAGTGACVFRRSRPPIPSEVGRLYRLKPAGDSDDPCHLPRRALVSTLSSGQLVGWSSSL